MATAPKRFTLTPNAAALAGAALVLTAGLGGLRLGFAEDVDSLGIARSAEAILAGGYERSRVLGVPLYELIAAGLMGLGGVMFVNLASLLFTLGAVGFLWAALRRAGGKGAAFALLAASASPLVLINASAMMETSLLALCVSAGLWAAVAAAATGERRLVIAAALAGSLATAVRPDAALFALALGASLAFEQRQSWKKAWETLAWFAGFGLLAIGLYGLMNGGFAFLDQVAVSKDNAGRSLARAVLGAATVLGLFGAVVLAVTLGRVARDPEDAWLRAARASPAARVALLIAITAGLLYGLRFLALPDELEYLLPAFLALCVALGAFAGRLTCALFAMSLLVANVAQIALFERRGEEVRAAVSLQPGALVQDWAFRRHNQWLRAPETQATLSALIGEPGVAPDTTYLWLNGVAFPGGGLVLGADQLYRFLVAGDGDPHHLSAYRTAVVCPTAIVPRRGWRVLQPPGLDALHGPPSWAEGCRSFTPQPALAAGPLDAAGGYGPPPSPSRLPAPGL